MSSQNYNDPEMQEIFDSFLVETSELLDKVSEDLMTIENAPDDIELLNRIFRSFHTIKGTSSFMGVDKITEITHHAEDILNKLRKSEFLVTREIIDVLLEVHDWINLLMNSLGTQEYDKIDYAATIEQVERIKNTYSQANKEKPVEAEAEEDKEEDKEENGDSLNYVLENIDKFKNDGNMTEEEILLLDKAFLEMNNQLMAADKSANLSGSNNTSIAELESAEQEQEPKAVINHEANNKPAPVKEAQAHAGQNQAAETLRVDVSRVEALMDLSGELVLGRNRLSQINKQISKMFDNNKDIIRELMETTVQIDFITSEIQATVMRMRMVQMGKLYQKAPRIIRDLSKEFDKKIKLTLKGEETEIDKSIIEELNDPLVHMIRNSCDHGIEKPEERKALGKPEEGTITLDAYQDGNNIVIKISDDGRGIDPEKLKAKALEKGIITQEQAEQMSRRDALQLVFAAGFSTASVVSAVSGRGVGMDVVITNIKKLKGMIDIDTEIGAGTTFTIKLPLTLAIIQGLLVKVNNETYALPLSSVEEVVAASKENIGMVNQKETIRIRQNVLPLIRLNETLGSESQDKSLGGKYVVIMGIDIHRVGLVVDELLGQQEIVIKSIGEYLGHVQGMAGSTILGDGRVIMIIDIGDLILKNAL